MKSILDFEFFYCNGGYYDDNERFSCFNMFEYDGSLYTSKAGAATNVDLMAYFTFQEKKDARK